MHDKPTALYRHYDAAETLLYVGMPLHHSSRLAAHMRASGWSGSIASVRIQHFPNRAEAKAAETLAIQTENPVWNIKESLAAQPFVPRSPQIGMNRAQPSKLWTDAMTAQAVAALERAAEHVRWIKRQGGNVTAVLPDSIELTWHGRRHPLNVVGGTVMPLLIATHRGSVQTLGSMLTETDGKDEATKLCSTFHREHVVREALYSKVVLTRAAHDALNPAMDRYKASFGVPDVPVPNGIELAQETYRQETELKAYSVARRRR